MKKKDVIYSFAAGSRTCTENGGIAEFLAKLLALLLDLAGLAWCGGSGLLLLSARGHVEGHVAVVGGGGRGVVGGGYGFLFFAHVAGREDAVHAGALVAALPPLVVHVLGDGDLVVGHEGEVAGVLGVVLVHGRGVAEDGGAGGDHRGRGVGGRRGIGGGIRVVANVGAALLRWRRRLAVLHAELRQLLRGHGGGQLAGAVLGRHGQLGGDDIVLGRRDDVGLDEELEVLYARDTWLTRMIWRSEGARALYGVA